MKYLRLLILLLLTSSCLRFDPPHIIEADRALRFGKVHAKNNSLHLIGEGGAMMTNIKGFSLTFTTQEKLTIAKARQIIIEEVLSLLNFINTDQKILPYLNEYPFSISHIDYSIMGYDDKTNEIISPPFIALVFTKGNKIFYDIYHSERAYGQRYETIHEETCDEALEIVNVEMSGVSFAY